MKTLLSKMRLSEEFKALKPTTFSGKSLMEKYVGFDGSSFVQTYNMLTECAMSEDKVINSWAKSSQANISANIPHLFRIGYILESTKQNNTFGAEAINEQLGHLLYYSDTDVKLAIKNGILESVMDLNPGLAQLHEALTQVPTNKKITSNTHICYNPISYICESNGQQYFRVEGKTYVFNKEAIKEVAQNTVPDANFIDVNNSVERLPFDTDKEMYSISMLPGTVNITKKGKVTINGEEVDKEEFVGAMSNAISDCLDPKLKAYNAQCADDICHIMENWDKIAIMDNIHVCKNMHTNESYVLMSHPNKYYLVEHLSTGYNFTEKLSINESVKFIKDATNINLSAYYNRAMLNEQKDYEQMQKIYEDQVKVKKQIQEGLEEIAISMAITPKSNPKYTQLLETKSRLEEQLILADHNIGNFEMVLNSVKL